MTDQDSSCRSSTAALPQFFQWHSSRLRDATFKKKDHQIFWPSKFPSRNFFPTIFPVFDWHWFNFNILAVQFSHFCEILLSMFPQETIYCRNHHLIFPESSSHVPVLSFVEVNGKKQSASVNNNFQRGACWNRTYIKAAMNQSFS